MIKIKVSYEYRSELDQVIALLRPRVKLIKHSNNGKYKKAYIELKQGDTSDKKT